MYACKQSKMHRRTHSSHSADVDAGGFCMRALGRIIKMLMLAASFLRPLRSQASRRGHKAHGAQPSQMSGRLDPGRLHVTARYNMPGLHTERNCSLRGPEARTANLDCSSYSHRIL